MARPLKRCRYDDYHGQHIQLGRAPQIKSADEPALLVLRYWKARRLPTGKGPCPVRVQVITSYAVTATGDGRRSNGGTIPVEVRSRRCRNRRGVRQHRERRLLPRIRHDHPGLLQQLHRLRRTRPSSRGRPDAHPTGDGRQFLTVAENAGRSGTPPARRLPAFAAGSSSSACALRPPPVTFGCTERSRVSRHCWPACGSRPAQPGLRTPPPQRTRVPPRQGLATASFTPPGLSG